jgi:hypothetical protein
VEYFNDGDRDDPPADWKNVFVNAIEDMKRYEWEKPFNEWVWKAKSGKMERISGGGLSIKDTNGRKLPGAFGAVYRGTGTQDEAASVIFADIPDVKQAPLIDGGWLVLKNSASMPHPEYSVSISRENSMETVSFRKSLGDDEVWTIDCGRLNQPYREYRKGSAAIFRESTANGSLRFWLVDIEP